jgi:hypothetical protein
LRQWPGSRWDRLSQGIQRITLSLTGTSGGFKCDTERGAHRPCRSTGRHSSAKSRPLDSSQVTSGRRLGKGCVRLLRKWVRAYPQRNRLGIRWHDLGRDGSVARFVSNRSQTVDAMVLRRHRGPIPRWCISEWESPFLRAAYRAVLLTQCQSSQRTQMRDDRRGYRTRRR